MNQQRFVNDRGLAALNRLSNEKPGLFLEADPDALTRAMEEQEDTDDLWGISLDLREDISALNQIESSGPSTDAEYAALVRKALDHLPPAEGLNEHRWATINCFVIPQYVPKRWQSSNQANDPQKLSNFVQSHWLKGGLVGARRANAVARLWWLGEFSDRAAEHTDMYSADELLDAMARNVNLYHQLLSRPNLLSRSRLVTAIYEVFLEPDNDYLNATRYANEMLESLNFLAAHVSLDFMDMSELREAVEEAKPPKEP